MKTAMGLFFRISTLLLTLSLFSIPAEAQQEAPSVGNLFIQAYEKSDEAAMKELIKTRTSEFPGEVKAMVEYAMSPDAAPEEQDYLFSVAGLIARMYGDQTGDQRLFEAIKANYAALRERRKAGAMDPNAVAVAKKEITELGSGNWRINVFKLDRNGDLIVEIDVRESTGGANFTPRIEFKVSEKTKEIIKAKLPVVKKAKISWSSMGVGLKTAFIE